MIGLGLGLTRGGGIAPSLDLNFLTGTMPSGLTFTRASTATYIGSDGLLKTAAVDVPRFDYDPVTLACKGLLIEGSRTNSIPWSEVFSNVVWTKSASSISANILAAPDGVLTADKLIEDSTTAGHHVNQPFTFVSGTTYTVSCFVKSSERTSIQLILTSGAFGANVIGAYDLVNGLSSSSGGGAASIQNVGNGWWRCSMKATATASVSALVQVRLANTYSAAAPSSYTGDGTSGIFIWGVQLEVGTFPSSYIPTTTAAVTRAADVCLMTGADFSRWFNPLEGTFLWEFGPSGGVVLGGVGDTFDNVQYFTADSGYATFRSGGVSQAQFFLGAANAGGKVAWAYRQNDFAACYNGGVVGTDTSGNVPLSNVRLTVGSNPWAANGGSALDGHIRRIRDWPRRLSNARLQELTA